LKNSRKYTKKTTREAKKNDENQGIYNPKYLEKIIQGTNFNMQRSLAGRLQNALEFIVSMLKSEAMNVKIQTVHFEADNKLVDYVNKKLMRLDTFHDRIVKVEVFLKLDNVVHTIKDKVAEIKVHVPRQDYFVKCSSKSFEESFDKAMGSLINMIKRKKDKQAA
jgi:putative sigma-54 modulation protein